MVNQQELNATVKLSKEKEEDMYQKYMHNEFKIQPTNKYSFPGKNDEYLKGRTNLQADTFRPDVVR